MDEYIKREDVVSRQAYVNADAVKKVLDKYTKFFEERTVFRWTELLSDMGKIKVVPAREVMIGQWVKREDGCVVCSLCDTPAEQNPINDRFMKMPYCSLCGARMENW